MSLLIMRILSASMTLAIAVASIVPGAGADRQRVLGIATSSSGAELHALAYALWMVVAMQAFPGRLAAATAVGLALGTILEGVQMLLPYRSFNPLDLLANGSGMILGAGLGLILSRLWPGHRGENTGWN